MHTNEHNSAHPIAHQYIGSRVVFSSKLKHFDLLAVSVSAIVCICVCVCVRVVVNGPPRIQFHRPISYMIVWVSVELGCSYLTLPTALIGFFFFMQRHYYNQLSNAARLISSAYSDLSWLHQTHYNATHWQQNKVATKIILLLLPITYYTLEFGQRPMKLQRATQQWSTLARSHSLKHTRTHTFTNKREALSSTHLQWIWRT